MVANSSRARCRGRSCGRNRLVEAVAAGMQFLVVAARLEAERIEIGVQMTAHADRRESSSSRAPNRASRVEYPYRPPHRRRRRFGDGDLRCAQFAFSLETRSPFRRRSANRRLPAPRVICSSRRHRRSWRPVRPFAPSVGPTIDGFVDATSASSPSEGSKNLAPSGLVPPPSPGPCRSAPATPRPRPFVASRRGTPCARKGVWLMSCFAS